MSQTLSVKDANMKGYNLSITTRACGDPLEVMEEITYRTIKAWLWIADRLEQQVYDLPLDPETGNFMASVEERYLIEKRETDPEFNLAEAWGDSRTTVWNTYRSTLRTDFHLDSDDIPQVAVDTWLANNRAIERVLAETPQNAVKSAQDAPNSSVPAPQGNNAPATTKASNTPAAPVEGAIVATRAPNSNRPDYANGQLVSFTVTKIVASSNKGSAVYQMWTPLGNQYPTLSVYKLKPDGNLKPDYEAIVPVLNTLNLSLDKPEAVGTWRLVCKAAHVPSKDGADKEYLNVVSLTAI